MIRELLENFVANFLGDFMLYNRLYGAQVVAPSSGDTVDILPDDETIRGMGLQNVQVEYGAPAYKAQILPGTRVILFFLDGKRDKPRVMCPTGPALAVSIMDGKKPVARLGDSITGTAGPYPVTGTIISGNLQVTA